MKLTLLIAAALAVTAHATKPHIFLVLVDDFGWANSGFHPRGERSSTESEVNTPVMKNLLDQGILLKRHYTYNFCSPSRSSLQSGRLPQHVSFLNDQMLAYNSKDSVAGMAGIARNMTGVAELMKRAGYVTHMSGKWDAGMAAYENTPQGKGYDTFFGYYHHANDYWTEKCTVASTGEKDLCVRNGIELTDMWISKDGGPGEPAIGRNGTGEYEDEIFTQHSVNLIEKHDASVPLFLFHSFHVIHTPLQAPDSYMERMSFLANKKIGNDLRQTYAAMVNFCDEALGRIVGALMKKGMWENTLMILSSDNGGPVYSAKMTGVYGSANNIPLRGGKMTDWEGGVRTNAFVSGGYIPVSKRGTESHDLIHIADWYSTLAEIAGVDPTDKKAEIAGLPAHDSISVLGSLLKGDDKPERDEVWLSRYALLQPPYKLLLGGENEWIDTIDAKPHWPGVKDVRDVVLMDAHVQGWNTTSSDDAFMRVKKCADGCLFNVYDDETEDHEISADHPDIVKSMKARLAELNKSTFLPDRGSEALMAACDAGAKVGGYYTAWVTDPPIHKNNYLERMKAGLPHRDWYFRPRSAVPQ